MSFWVNGIVAIRDKQPYVQLSNEKGMIAQLTMAEVRTIAMDMLAMAARTEADAIILKFFERSEFPPEAGVHLMQMFRDFRSELDAEKVERSEGDGESRIGGIDD